MIATEIEIVEQPVSAGDRLIVCSDGVHDNLAAPEIDDIVAAHRHASDDELARALCAAARERADDRAHLRAKDDDITAAVLPVT
jgi:protein phosphatase